MNIYQLNNQEIKREMKAFHKTVYGKTTLLLSSCVPVITLIILLVILSSSVCAPCVLWFLFLPMMLLFLLLLISFVMGSIHYYNKLETYIQLQGKKK